MRRGDLVTRVDDRPVPSARAFYEMLETSIAGQELKIELRRSGKSQTIAVTLEELPQHQVVRFLDEMLGMELQPNPRGGYRVHSVRDGSGAAQIGIQSGDVVLGINGRTLEDDDALRRSVLDLRGRSHALVVVQRGGGRYHVTIPLV